jgi:hypothetical protein
MLNRGAPAVLLSLSSLACDNRTDELRARIPNVLLLSRCVWIGGDGEAASVEASDCAGEKLSRCRANTGRAPPGRDALVGLCGKVQALR